MKLLLEDLRVKLNKYMKMLFNCNEDIQKRVHVYSLSESYDLENMWGYYADSGKGFCIEYDYNLVQEQNLTTKRYLLNTFKVNYSNEPRALFAKILPEMHSFENNMQLLENVRRTTIGNLLQKEKCWEHEKEWRIILADQ